MLHEFGGSLTENTQSKSNLEAELLKIEIDKDSHKDGPMAQIVQLELEILNDEQSNSRFIHFIKTGDPQTLGERKFAF